MPTISDSAIVLKRLDFSETSQIVVLFTREHGKIRAICKGVKRGTKTRFAVGIDLLDVGRVVLSSRHERSSSLANLTEWKQLRSLTGLREKIFRLYAAEYAAEITAQLTEDWDPHAELFEALLNTLIDLSDASEPLRLTTRCQLALLRSIGSMPRFDSCVLCGRSEDLTFFSSLEGGLICRHCEPGQVEKREVSRATIAVVRGDASNAPFLGAFGVLNYHIAHLMGKEPLLASKLVSPEKRRVVD
ncbi:MAG: DNA repair protein RecO [Phycisphaerales bacterium]|nr:MAG: DNA repair protein RecO [Phycisphaerales bacterium]